MHAHRQQAAGEPRATWHSRPQAEALKIVCRAFEEAWTSIAGNFGNDPAAIEAARLKLANIILSFPHNEIKDAEQIKQSSLQIMALQYGHSQATSSSAGE
jgi:hypothetical protein